MFKTIRKVMIASLFAVLLMLIGFAFNMQKVFADDPCVLTMREGAYVRIGNTTGTGIRFLANIPEEYVTGNDEDGWRLDSTKGLTEVGMIIVPSSKLTGLEENQNVFDYFSSTYGKTKAQISAHTTKVHHDEDGYFIVGAIIDILDANIDNDYQAIAYTYDGANYKFSAAGSTRSIHYVFNAALEQEEFPANRAEVLSKVVEMQSKLKFGDIRITKCDGYDLSKFAISDDDDWSIVSAGVGVNTATPNDNVIEPDALPYQATIGYGAAKDFTITYANSKTLTFPAEVWDREIKDNTDFEAFLGLTGSGEIGYVGVTDDITCDINTPLVSTASPSNNNFVFDGRNHKIENFYGRLTNTVLCEMKDVDFINCKPAANGSLLSNILRAGSVFSNVNIIVTLAATSWQGIITGYIYSGTVNLNNVNVVVKDNYGVTSTGTSYTNGFRNGLVGKIYSSTIGSLSGLKCTDCTFVTSSSRFFEFLPFGTIYNNASYKNYAFYTDNTDNQYSKLLYGTYKWYDYSNLAQAAVDVADPEKSTASFRSFVSNYSLGSAWGPIGAIAISDTLGLKDMVSSGTAVPYGYYYLTNDITFDATAFSYTAVAEGGRDVSNVLYSYLDGNGHAIKGLTRHLFCKFGGTVQNLAIIKATSQHSGWGRGLISSFSAGNMIIDNVFIYGYVGAKNSNPAALNDVDGLIVAYARAPFTLKDVVIVSGNTVGSEYYSGAIAGLAYKTDDYSATKGQAVTCTNDNTLIISGNRLVGAVASSDKYQIASELDGEGTAGHCSDFMTGTYNIYADRSAFESAHSVTLTAQNLAYYNSVFSASYSNPS